MTWWRGVRNFVLVVDALFSLPRMAAVYDPLDPDRPDLEVYAAMAAEFRARSVLTSAVRDSLVAAGFTVDQIRDAPDRPGREFVFVATRSA